MKKEGKGSLAGDEPVFRLVKDNKQPKKPKPQSPKGRNPTRRDF